MNPLISVVVPIYNDEKYLENCISSIVNQSYKDFEIVLVNDGSTDSSGDIIRSFELQDQRIIVVNKANGGPTSARCAGVAVASGSYIMLVDGDDCLSVDAVKDIYNILSEDAAIDIICTGYTRIKESKKTAVFENYEAGIYNKQRLETEIYPYMMSCYKNIPGKIIRAIWAKVVRKGLLLQVLDQMDESIIVGEDSATSYACLYLANKIYIDSKNINYCYHYMKKTLSHSYNAMWLENIEHYSEWMHTFFAQCEYKCITDAIAYEIFVQFYECFDFEIGHCLEKKKSLKNRFHEIIKSPTGKRVFSQVRIKKLPLSISVRLKIWLIKNEVIWPFAITYYLRNLKERET